MIAVASAPSSNAAALRRPARELALGAPRASTRRTRRPPIAHAAMDAQLPRRRRRRRALAAAEAAAARLAEERSAGKDRRSGARAEVRRRRRGVAAPTRDELLQRASPKRAPRTPRARASDAASVSERREALAATEVGRVAAEQPSAALKESADASRAGAGVSIRAAAESSLVAQRSPPAACAVERSRASPTTARRAKSRARARHRAGCARTRRRAVKRGFSRDADGGGLAVYRLEDAMSAPRRVRGERRSTRRQRSAARLSAPSERTPIRVRRTSPPRARRPRFWRRSTSTLPCRTRHRPRGSRGARRGGTHRASAKTRLSRNTLSRRIIADGTPSSIGRGGALVRGQGERQGTRDDPNVIVGGVFRGWRDSRVLAARVDGADGDRDNSTRATCLTVAAAIAVLRARRSAIRGHRVLVRGASCGSS